MPSLPFKIATAHTYGPPFVLNLEHRQEYLLKIGNHLEKKFLLGSLGGRSGSLEKGKNERFK
jgi:hypothetical protein